MIDLGLFLSDSFNQPLRLVDEKLLSLSKSPIQGGLVHFNEYLFAHNLVASSFQVAVDARMLGAPEADARQINYVTYRAAVTEKPAAISPIIANCADRGALLIVSSPYADGQSASPALAARSGLRQVNYALARSLLAFLCEEATFYGCRLHILGASSAEELDILQAYKKSSGLLTVSAPAYLFTASEANSTYDWDGQLCPAPISISQQQDFLDRILQGHMDAITSHHHLYAEPLELDPLSAESGSSTAHVLAKHLHILENQLGKTLLDKLTLSNPAQIISNAKLDL